MPFKGIFQKQSIDTKKHSQFNSMTKRSSSDHDSRHYYNIPRNGIQDTQLYRVPVRIGKHGTKALVDMAAEASVLAPHILNKLPTSSITNIPNNKNVVFAGFTGAPTTSSGKFQIPITIQKRHHFEHDFYVVPGTTYKCILGLYFMHKYGLLFDAKERSISYDRNGVKQN